MGTVKVDIKQLKTLRDRLQRLDDGGARQTFCEDCAKELAARLLRLVKKRTPVDTGYLRKGWTCGNVEKHGDTYTVTIENNVEYAPYVEFGHRTRGGGWVAGRFMLTLSEQDLEAIAPGILEKKLNTFLREAFG
ncbi:MAG: HK97 gp10 family phage protein [Clostridia bacterium]|nr:HK97 gp10 family phage protein [Clostridia bacterium]